MIGDKASLYHSALVHAGQVEVTITSAGPTPSKYAGKPPFIGLQHEGFSHTYNIENDACGAALSGLKGQTVLIEATGREGDANIYVTDLEGNPFDGQQAPPPRPAPAQRQAPPSPRAATPVSRQQAAPQRQAAPVAHAAPQRSGQAKHLTPEERAAAEEKAFRKMKQLGARVAVAMESSYRFAQKLMSDLAIEYSTEDLRATALCHFIEVKGTTDLHALPMLWLDLTKPAAKPAPAQRQPAARQPDPEPEPQPAAEPPPDDDYASDDIAF